MEVTYVLNSTCLSVRGNDFYFTFSPASRSCVSQHRSDRERPRQCYDIHLFRNLTSYLQENKVVSVTKIHAPIAGCWVFNATADGTEWYSADISVKCEVSVRVLRWSFCPCLEFPDFLYLIMRVYCNFLSYLYYIPVFVL